MATPHQAFPDECDGVRTGKGPSSYKDSVSLKFWEVLKHVFYSI